jgi:pimeloyl-ACP methyl ester carboxylesterase
VQAAATGLASLVEASGLRRTALVGHSMGSLIALEPQHFNSAPARW